jgi:hypothetical protein
MSDDPTIKLGDEIIEKVGHLVNDFRHLRGVVDLHRDRTAAMTADLTKTRLDLQTAHRLIETQARLIESLQRDLAAFRMPQTESGRRLLRLMLDEEL